MKEIEICDEFIIEDLGIQEHWVYDIEVEDNHNFFGNNILVHNSVYFHIEPFVEAFKNKNNASLEECIEFADKFEQKYIAPVVQKTIDDFADELNAYNKEIIGAEREVISDSGVFSAKKKYYMRVRDNEGTRYSLDDPYIKVMGLEIKKSSTPKWSQEKLEEAIPVILDSSEHELIDWLENTKSEYLNANIVDTAGIGGVSNLDYTLGQKGIPIGSRAAIIHNEYIKKNNLTNIYSPIQAGDKPKRLYLIEPNPFNSNIISFTNDHFIEEIKDYIDYDLNFEKYFLKPLEIMVESLNWNITNPAQSLDDW